MRDMVRLNAHGNIDQQDNTYGWRSNYQLLRVLGKGGFATTYLGQSAPLPLLSPC